MRNPGEQDSWRPIEFQEECPILGLIRLEFRERGNRIASMRPMVDVASAGHKPRLLDQVRDVIRRKRNICLPLRDFSSLRTHGRAAYCNRRRVDTRFRLLKYCSRSEPSVENCGSPTLRFSEVLDFSLSFCWRHPAAWPAAFQITFKNNAESSLFELLRDVFGKNFQSSMPFVWFLMFISFHKCGITGLSQVSVVWHAIAPEFSRLGISSAGSRSPAFFHAPMVT